MEIDFKKLKDRVTRLSERREGVSLVYFVRAEREHSLIFDELLDAIDSAAPNLMRWVPRDALHVTVVRSKSTTGHIDVSGFAELPMLRHRSDMPHITWLTPVLDDDGAIRVPARLYLTTEIEEYLVECQQTLATKIMQPVELQKSFWATLGTIQRNTGKSVHIVQKLLNSSWRFVGRTVTVEKLALVHYVDLNFEKTQTVAEINLS